MKIGILTFHYVHNYGAVLQAYALKAFLTNCGHDAYVIDYQCDAVKNQYPQNMYSLIHKKWFFQPNKWNALKEDLKRINASNSQWTKRTAVFETFIEEYLCTNPAPWQERLRNSDLLLFGSDQIWEKNLTGGVYDDIYIGKFQTNAKKVSYAASCYKVDREVDRTLMEALKSFDALSVREDKLADVLTAAMNCRVACVCDPVFLLDKSNYESIAVCEEKGYILIYSVVNNEQLNQIAESFRNTGKRVIEIASYRTNKNDLKRMDYSPVQFLGLVQNADYVVTNSFHGTAFSIIFEKQFSIIGGGIRIKNLLQKSGLESRGINAPKKIKEQLEQKVEYGYLNSLDSYIENSKRYLLSVLESFEESLP